LVKIDLDGKIVGDSHYDVNPAGFTIHSAVHAARPDAGCVLHTHTEAGVAVSSLDGGFEPMNQWSLHFYNRVAYHEYEGIALELDERVRLVRNLGITANVLILRNHGLLTLGRSVAEALIRMLQLERACRAQLAIQATGLAIRPIASEVCERTLRQCESGDGNRIAGETQPQERAWRALLQRLEPVPPSSFRD
jgi:ribulose-5-phosphate 4-epimerase/fuculose-1-phosphate aldolase